MAAMWKMDSPRWVHSKRATIRRKRSTYRWEWLFRSWVLVLGMHFYGDNWAFLGPLTKFGLTHRYGELCRATGSRIVSFSSVNALPRTKRPAEGFLVFGGRFSADTRSDTCECRVLVAHVKSNNFFRSGPRPGITFLALSTKFYGIAAWFWKSFGLVENLIYLKIVIFVDIQLCEIEGHQIQS